MAKMNCSQIQDLLADYSVGGIGWMRHRQMRDHLRKCPGCDRELRVLMASADLMRKLPEASPPDDLWGRIESGIAASEPVFSPRKRPLTRAVVMATAAIVAVVVLMLITNWQIRPISQIQEVPVSSAGLYVRTHLVATGQSPMLSAALVEPMLRTSERLNRGLDRK